MNSWEYVKNREEFFQQAAISALQGVIEAKGGVVLEIDAPLAAESAVRLAEALTEEMFGKE